MTHSFPTNTTRRKFNWGRWWTGGHKCFDVQGFHKPPEDHPLFSTLPSVWYYQNTNSSFSLTPFIFFLFSSKFILFIFRSVSFSLSFFLQFIFSFLHLQFRFSFFISDLFVHLFVYLFRGIHFFHCSWFFIPADRLELHSFFLSFFEFIFPLVFLHFLSVSYDFTFFLSL